MTRAFRIAGDGMAARLTPFTALVACEAPMRAETMDPGKSVGIGSTAQVVENLLQRPHQGAILLGDHR